MGIDYYQNKFYGYDKGATSVVTNPPFEKKLSEEFVRDVLSDFYLRKSLDEDEPKRTLHVLLRNEWDCASTRKDIFRSIYYRGKIVLTKRPRWFPRSEKDSSPRHNYAWYNFSNKMTLGHPPVSYYYISNDENNYKKVGKSYKRKTIEKGKEDYIYD